MKKDENLLNITAVTRKIGLTNKKNGKLATHTLRFWESQFVEIKPTILPGNRRFYSRKDIELIKLIKFLLKDQKLTIQGAKNVLKKKINTLDDYRSSSIKQDYYKLNIRKKTQKLLDKIKKLKKNG